MGSFTLPSVLPVPLLYNWDSPIEVTTTFSTDISTSITSAEERVALTRKPTRNIKIDFTGMDKNLTGQFIHYLSRLSSERYVFPFYTEAVKPTSDFSAGSHEIRYSSLFNYRFGEISSDGRNVLIVNFERVNGKMRATEYQYTNIIAGETLPSGGGGPGGSWYPSFYFNDALDFDITAERTRIYPLMEVQPRGENNFDIASQAHLYSTLEIEEVASKNLDVPKSADSYYQFHGAYPIFSGGVNISLIPGGGILTDATDVLLGRHSSRYISPQSKGFYFSLPLTAFNREDALKKIYFFEQRMGRFKPFYVLNPLVVFDVVTLAQDTVKVDFIGNIEDFRETWKYVYIKSKSGDTKIRKILSTTPVGDGWIVLFDSTITIDEVNAANMVGPAHLCRFSEDILVENWVTSEHCQLTFDVVELVNEIDVVMSVV